MNHQASDFKDSNFSDINSRNNCVDSKKMSEKIVSKIVSQEETVSSLPVVGIQAVTPEPTSLKSVEFSVIGQYNEAVSPQHCKFILTFVISMMKILYLHQVNC